MSITIGGRSTSWHNIQAKVDGVPFSGFTEITFGDSLEETLGYGMGLSGKPTRRSHGKYTPDECSAKGYRADLMLLLQQITAKSGPALSYSHGEFVFIVSFAFMESEPVSTVVLDRCRILSVNESHTESADLSQLELKFRPLGIERDGLAGWDRLPTL